MRDHGAARRWVERSPRVISTITGELTREQREWLAVLHAGERSMLGGLAAAARHGLAGWERDVITVYVDDELSFEPVDGVRFFRSRRPFELLRHPRPGLPTARLEPAVLLFAAYQSSPRPAHALLAASVQQRLTTVERLVEWVDTLRPLRWSQPFKRTLGDIAGGAHSGAELDVRREDPARGRRRLGALVSLGKFHRPADETHAGTTKVHRPGMRFVGRPMKLSAG